MPWSPERHVGSSVALGGNHRLVAPRLAVVGGAPREDVQAPAVAAVVLVPLRDGENEPRRAQLATEGEARADHVDAGWRGRGRSGRCAGSLIAARSRAEQNQHQ
jgi:hypothetical protein